MQPGISRSTSLDAGNTYRLTITAPGFSEWDSPEIALQPGEDLALDDIAMKISAVETSVTAVFAEHLAAQQVKHEEEQRVLGVVPSYYVAYEKNTLPDVSVPEIQSRHQG